MTTHQPSRLIAGHCPDCRKMVVVFNNHETWPLVECSCGWVGATTDIDNHVRLERNGVLVVEEPPPPSIVCAQCGRKGGLYLGQDDVCAGCSW